MQVYSNTLSNMVGWMEANPSASIAGCHLKNEKGETIPHTRRFPSVWDQLAIILKIPHIFPLVLNKYLMKDFDYSQEAEVDSIRGSFFMLRKSVIEKLGGLDELYFIWFEEVDYCRQANSAGLKIFYTPAVECLDYVGQSFGQVNNLKTQKYFRDSMLKYFRKWHPTWQYWLLRLVWPIGVLMVWVAVKKKK
jgi:GT2 family glycosyltransferase